MLEKLTELLTKIFNFIKGLASSFVNDLDKLPIKGGLEWVIVILLIGLVLLTLSSGLSSFFRAAGEFLKRVARFLRWGVFVGIIIALVFTFSYWFFLSKRDCFSQNSEFETKRTNCKTEPQKPTTSKGKKS